MLVNEHACLKSVSPLSDDRIHSRNHRNLGIAVADELQRKAALQTTEPVIISTNQVTGKIMRSGSSALTLGKLSGNRGEEIRVLTGKRFVIDRERATHS